MNSIYDHDPLLFVDIDELGIRPSNSIDDNNDIDDPIHGYFDSEKTVDITVFSAEVYITNTEKKSIFSEDESSISDDEDPNFYDTDPETGEKTFRILAPVINTDSATSPSAWIEEYFSNIETQPHQFLNATTTVDNPEIFENIPTTFFENFEEKIESDWFTNLLGLDENSDNNIITNSMISSQSLDTNDNTSQEITIPSSNDNSFVNPFSIMADDEYSNYSEMTFDDSKSEQMGPDGESMTRIRMRRSSTRSISQRQQDEEALQQLNIPLSIDDIIQSTTDEYNRHLARLNYLTPHQMSIVKDIRRRGKNKIAAQNCRKRKATSVETLSDQVEELKRVKNELEERKLAILQQISETRHQYEYLHQSVLPDRQLPPAITVK